MFGSFPFAGSYFAGGSLVESAQQAASGASESVVVIEATGAGSRQSQVAVRNNPWSSSMQPRPPVVPFLRISGASTAAIRVASRGRGRILGGASVAAVVIAADGAHATQRSGDGSAVVGIRTKQAASTRRQTDARTQARVVTQPVLVMSDVVVQPRRRRMTADDEADLLELLEVA
jgi:hypothetical protein